MAKAAQAEELRAAFEKHEQETEGHVERLEKVFEELGESPGGKTCDAIVGIIAESQEVMKDYKGMPALDAGLLAAAQASNITRCRATAASKPGRPSLASVMPPTCSKPRWPKKRKPTQR
jgi:ferritin-like metal-binding protein YciE